jgi:hypothetical protein
MSIIAKSSGGGEDFKPVPVGLHPAVCDMIVDLGLQEPKQKEFKTTYQIYMRWQFPAQRIEVERNGKKESLPMVLGKFYNLSLHPKSNLYKDLEAWRGKKFTSEELYGFDTSSMIGLPANLVVQHFEGNDNSIRAKIVNILQFTDENPPRVEGEAIIFDYDENYHNLENIPDWLQTKVKTRVRADEFVPPDDSPEAGAVDDPGHDEIPI